AARALLATLPAGPEALALTDVLPLEETLALREAGDDWTQVSPAGAGALPWWVRTRTLDDGGQLVALCTPSQEWRRYDPRVRMLLGLPLGVATAPVFSEPLLLVDDSETIRETFVAQLGARGGVGHAAGRHRQAIEIFRGNASIRSVILDWAMPGENLRATVAQLREIRPDVRLIGTSGEDRRAEFGGLGIDAFLLKPWTVAGDLKSLLEAESHESPQEHR
ncbi:MAG: response regulator, partial [Myxococcales bacterium]|nr:response regulator [Myxococcales bacterium]